MEYVEHLRVKSLCQPTDTRKDMRGMRAGLSALVTAWNTVWLQAARGRAEAARNGLPARFYKAQGWQAPHDVLK